MKNSFPQPRIQQSLAFALALWLGVDVGAPASEVQGFIEPYQDIDVAASEMGIIEAILVKEGDRVRSGQVLVQMDSKELQVTLAIAKEIKESRGRLESASAELQLQSELVQSLVELRSRDHASDQELDRARKQMEIAKARLLSVQEELYVKTLEHERVKVQMERRRLRSPIDGICTQINRDPGESVLLSDPVVVKVVQLDPLLVIFLVPANEARSLKTDDDVEVRILGIEKPVQGRVEFVSPTTDPQSGLTRVRVRVPNPEEQLPCGATCYLILDEKGFFPAGASNQ